MQLTLFLSIGHGEGDECGKNQARQGYDFPERALSNPDTDPHVLDPLDL